MQAIKGIYNIKSGRNSMIIDNSEKSKSQVIKIQNDH